MCVLSCTLPTNPYRIQYYQVSEPDANFWLRVLSSHVLAVSSACGRRGLTPGESPSADYYCRNTNSTRMSRDLQIHQPEVRATHRPRLFLAEGLPAHD